MSKERAFHGYPPTPPPHQPNRAFVPPLFVTTIACVTMYFERLGAMLVTLILFQSATIAGPPVLLDLASIDAVPGSMERIKPLQTRFCPPDADGDIIVCGSSDPTEKHRLRSVPERYPDRKRVGVDLPGNGWFGPEIAQGRLGEGQIQMTLKIPF
ncbi:MAG: hypothetical protein K2X59_03650 [Sphingomonas sp.]|nr:hypothetical protein [Sphingomonas sp.]